MAKPPSWPRRGLSGAAKFFTAATLGAAAATTAGALAARRFGVRYETLALLPPGHAPLRILHIGDMHLVARDQRKIAFLRGLAALDPDVVVNTGDNPGGVDAVDDVLTALETLLDIPGVFVPGSNDLFGPRTANPLRYLIAPSALDNDDELYDGIDAATMFSGFTYSGAWHRLDNRTHRMAIRDDLVLDFAGTHDAHLNADRWPGFAPSSNSPDDAAHLRIAVTHAPYRRVLDAAVADGARLILAGHTHGGQVALPGYGALVTNCDLPTGLAAGMFSWRAAARRGLVNVTAGIGASPTVPLRTFCPPEAVVIDLVAP